MDLGSIVFVKRFFNGFFIDFLENQITMFIFPSLIKYAG